MRPMRHPWTIPANILFNNITYFSVKQITANRNHSKELWSYLLHSNMEQNIVHKTVTCQLCHLYPMPWPLSVNQFRAFKFGHYPLNWYYSTHILLAVLVLQSSILVCVSLIAIMNSSLKKLHHCDATLQAYCSIKFLNI